MGSHRPSVAHPGCRQRRQAPARWVKCRTQGGWGQDQSPCRSLRGCAHPWVESAKRVSHGSLESRLLTSRRIQLVVCVLLASVGFQAQDPVSVARWAPYGLSLPGWLSPEQGGNLGSCWHCIWFLAPRCLVSQGPTCPQHDSRDVEPQAQSHPASVALHISSLLQPQCAPQGSCL